LRKQEGVIKRDRMLKYSRSHQVKSLSRSLYIWFEVSRSCFCRREEVLICL